MKKRLKKFNFKNIIFFFLGIIIPIVGVYAAGQIEAKSISFNPKNDLKSTNVQDAIVEVLNAKKKTCPANKMCYKTICKRVKQNSGTVLYNNERCTLSDNEKFCSGAGYTTSGSKGTDEVEYGNIDPSSSLTAGDVFDCDVNGDGKYDRATERFYYVSDYYNTSTKEFEDDTAVLIYFNNVSTGTPNNSSTYLYDNSGKNNFGPRTAIAQLPTSSQWSNVSLKNTKRVILNENNKNATTGGTLPSAFDYAGHSARFINKAELENGCKNSNSSLKVTSTSYFDDKSCLYLLENTTFANASSANNGYWIENPYSVNDSDAFYVNAPYRSIQNANVGTSSSIGVRPVIEVPKVNLTL